MALRPALCIAACALALCVEIAAAKSGPGAASAPIPDAGGDPAGVLIGDLVFHADLLTALDRLCARNPAVDWHRPLAALLEEAFTPELRELSRRLGADAGAQLVQERGGCRSRGFEAAYKESKDEYRVLLERWKALGD